MFERKKEQQGMEEANTNRHINMQFLICSPDSYFHFKVPSPLSEHKEQEQLGRCNGISNKSNNSQILLPLFDWQFTYLPSIFFFSLVTTKCITCFVLRVLLECKCTQARNNFSDDITWSRLNARLLWVAWNLICAACEPCSGTWHRQFCSAPDLLPSQSPGCGYVFLCASSQG